MPNASAASFTSVRKCHAMEPIKWTGQPAYSYSITFLSKKSVKQESSNAWISALCRCADKKGVRLARKRLASGCRYTLSKIRAGVNSYSFSSSSHKSGGSCFWGSHPPGVYPARLRFLRPPICTPVEKHWKQFFHRRTRRNSILFPIYRQYLSCVRTRRGRLPTSHFPPQHGRVGNIRWGHLLRCMPFRACSRRHRNKVRWRCLFRQLREKVFCYLPAYFFGGKIKRIDAGSLDYPVIRLAVADAPIGFGGTTVCYYNHGYWLMVIVYAKIWIIIESECLINKTSLFRRWILFNHPRG